MQETLTTLIWNVDWKEKHWESYDEHALSGTDILSSQHMSIH